jgi:hypothetical protein
LNTGTIFSRFDGIYLSLDPNYVITYYSHGSDDPEDPQEVLATFKFDPNDIIDGNLTDRETEFRVSKAMLYDFKYLHGYSVNTP